MKLEELKAAPIVERNHHVIMFLPFVSLKAPCTVAGVEFVPLRGEKNQVPKVLEAADAPFQKILSG